MEKQVDGLAEKIVAEDEERRAQELVRGVSWAFISCTDRFSYLILGLVQYCTKTPELGLEARHGQEAGQIREKNPRIYSCFNPSVFSLLNTWIIS